MRRLLTIVLTLTLAMHMVGQTVWHHREAGCSAEASVAAKRRVADRLFTRAMLEMEERHFDAGYELLRQVQVISPDHSAAIFMQSTFESILRHDSIAEVLLRQCVTLDPNNPSYIEAMGAWYDRHDSVQQATRQYEKLLSLERQRTDVARHLHDIYMQQERYTDAVKMLDHVENIEGSGREIAQAKYSIYIEAMHDTAAAFAELYRMAKEYPVDVDHRLYLATCYISDRDMADSARILLDGVAMEEPNNVSLALARLEYAERYDSARCEAMTDSLLYAPTTAEELRYALIVSRLRRDVDDSTKVEGIYDMFHRLTAIAPNELSVWSTKVAYLQASKAPTDSLIFALENLRRIKPDNRIALTSLLQCYAEREDYASMASLCDDGIVHFPDECMFYYYSGMAYYNKDDKATALQRFTAAVRQIGEDTEPELAARMYAAQGDLLYAAGRKAEAYAAFDSCLVYNPDDVNCLNNYAYYLSLADSALAKAEKMSFRTLRLAPGERTYIDTYAWILFKQGDYGEARRYIDQVMEGISTADDMKKLDISAEVAEHAGDICACQDDMDNAMKWWQMALDMKCDNSALVKRKMKKRKYLAK